MQVKYTSRSGSSLTRGKPIEQVEENILLLLVGADWSLLTAEVTTKVSSRPPGDPQRQISTMFSKADTRLRHLLSHRACVFKLSRPTRTPRPCPMAGIDCAAGLRRHPCWLAAPCCLWGLSKYGNPEPVSFKYPKA